MRLVAATQPVGQKKMVVIVWRYEQGCCHCRLLRATRRWFVDTPEPLARQGEDDIGCCWADSERGRHTLSYCWLLIVYVYVRSHCGESHYVVMIP